MFPCYKRGQLLVFQHSTVVISSPVYLVQTNPVEHQQASLKFNDMQATAIRTTDHDMKQSYRLRKAVNQILLSLYRKKSTCTCNQHSSCVHTVSSGSSTLYKKHQIPTNIDVMYTSITNNITCKILVGGNFKQKFMPRYNF